ncbi:MULTISPECIES: hypothetical protein [unclassified Nostoc]|nr:hypothetical protein [Nostoc sp. S13]MDF5736914.1 hypothetical protein [Nostoc sp. S13]
MSRIFAAAIAITKSSNLYISDKKRKRYPLTEVGNDQHLSTII